MTGYKQSPVRLTYNSPVILTFSLLCVVVWLVGVFFPRLQLQFFSASPVLSLAYPGTLLGLITHCLGHANWNHLLSNLTLILLLGPMVEEKFGSPTLFVLILITAFVTGLCNAFFFDTGLMGASGIVFMLIMLGATANSTQGDIPLTFILVTLLFLGQEAAALFQDDSISQFAHLLGGVCGGFFGFLLRKKPASAG